MKKKFIIFHLITILFYPVLVLLYLFIQQMIVHQVRIHQDDFKDKFFSSSQQVELSRIEYEKQRMGSKEIKLNNKIHDIVEISLNENTVTLHVVEDKEGEEVLGIMKYLINILEEWISIIEIFSLTSSLNLFFEEFEKIVEKANKFCQILIYKEFEFFVVSNYIETLTPPPKNI